MRSYAIGDIHGHLGKLHEVHGWIGRDKAEVGDAAAPVGPLGDLVARGPYPPCVLAQLSSAPPARAPCALRWLTDGAHAWATACGGVRSLSLVGPVGCSGQCGVYLTLMSV